MNTVTCTTPDGKVRYYLADEQGIPVPEVLSYLKFLDAKVSDNVVYKKWKETEALGDPAPGS